MSNAARRSALPSAWVRSPCTIRPEPAFNFHGFRFVGFARRENRLTKLNILPP
jgi:hypothetical protein